MPGETVDAILMNSCGHKVSVGVLAYNQASYIREALDSILAQKTNFTYEVVVHDDFSTDGTREIVQAYVEAHPDRVRAILQSENQYSQGRRILQIILPEMTGEYFALLDGDDFWNSDRKLQTQVDHLDAHPDCALCQTKTLYYNEASRRIYRAFPLPSKRRERLYCKDLVPSNFIQTSAVMFRSDALPTFPPEFGSLKFGDYPFFAMLAQSGWIGYIDEPMTIYRTHENNLWHRTPRRPRVEAKRAVVRFLAAHLDPAHRQPWVDAANAPSWHSSAMTLMRALELLWNVKEQALYRMGYRPS